MINAELLIRAPTRVALTRGIRFFWTPITPTRRSGELPKVALKSPPTRAPRRSARASVAAPMKPARGTIAATAMKKRIQAGMGSSVESRVAATKASSAPRTRCSLVTMAQRTGRHSNG